MLKESIATWVILGFACGLATALAYIQLWHPQRLEPPARRAAANATDLRVRLAQHWARGGLLSESSSAWRPVCIGLALAALAAESLHDLDAILDEALDNERDPAALAVLREAAGELADTRRTGKVANSHDWPHVPLALAARRMLAAGLGEARQAAAERASEA